MALDASVLIGHFSPHDAHHRSATQILLDARPGTLVVHPVTLAEVLVGGVRIGRAMAMRDEIRAAGISVARIDDDHPLRLAELRAATGLRLPDCCVIDVAVRGRAVLATFDTALATAARRQGLTVVP